MVWPGGLDSKVPRDEFAAEAAARPCRWSGNCTPVYGQTPSREFTRALRARRRADEL